MQTKEDTIKKFWGACVPFMGDLLWTTKALDACTPWMSATYWRRVIKADPTLVEDEDYFVLTGDGLEEFKAMHGKAKGGRLFVACGRAIERIIARHLDGAMRKQPVDEESEAEAPSEPSFAKIVGNDVAVALFVMHVPSFAPGCHEPPDSISTNDLRCLYWSGDREHASNVLGRAAAKRKRMTLISCDAESTKLLDVGANDCARPRLIGDTKKFIYGHMVTGSERAVDVLAADIESTAAADDLAAHGPALSLREPAADGVEKLTFDLREPTPDPVKIWCENGDDEPDTPEDWLHDILGVETKRAEQRHNALLGTMKAALEWGADTSSNIIGSLSEITKRLDALSLADGPLAEPLAASFRTTAKLVAESHNRITTGLERLNDRLDTIERQTRQDAHSAPETPAAYPSPAPAIVEAPAAIYASHTLTLNPSASHAA